MYPDVWCEATVSPLHKKGPKSEAREISLSCMFLKVFPKILNSRMMSRAAYKQNIDSNQDAYQKGKSSIDHIYTLMAIVQKYLLKADERFYRVFIDFSKCFESIPNLHL